MIGKVIVIAFALSSGLWLLWKGLHFMVEEMHPMTIYVIGAVLIIIMFSVLIAQAI